MLTDEELIDNVNPFVMHDFSLPGGVRQTGNFEDFSEIRSEPGIPEPSRSVYCDFGSCEDSKVECSLSRPVHPRRNIDYGFTRQRNRILQKVRVGISNNPKFSMIGMIIITLFILAVLYYATR